MSGATVVIAFGGGANAAVCTVCSAGPGAAGTAAATRGVAEALCAGATHIGTAFALAVAHCGNVQAWAP